MTNPSRDIYGTIVHLYICTFGARYKAVMLLSVLTMVYFHRDTKKENVVGQAFLL